MTFKVLIDDMLKVIHHSNVCSARDLASKNLCLDPLNENFPEVITSLQQQPVVDSNSPSLDHGEQQAHMQHSNDLTYPMAIIDPQDLVRRTFLMDTRNDGQCFHARIVEYIDEHTLVCLPTPMALSLRELVPSNITSEWFSIVMNMAHSASLPRGTLTRWWTRINSYLVASHPPRLFLCSREETTQRSMTQSSSMRRILRSTSLWLARCNGQSPLDDST